MNAEDNIHKILSNDIEDKMINNIYYSDKLSLYGCTNNIQILNIDSSYKKNDIIINDNNGNELVKIETGTGNFYIKGKLITNNELVGRYLSNLGQHDVMQLIRKELSNNPECIEEIINELRREKINNIIK